MLRRQVARHKAILESMDPEYVARVLAQAAVTIEQPSSTSGKWERVRSLMASDAVVNCPEHQNLYTTLQDWHDEVHRLSERQRLSVDEFAKGLANFIPAS